MLGLRCLIHIPKVSDMIRAFPQLWRKSCTRKTINAHVNRRVLRKSCMRELHPTKQKDSCPCHFPVVCHCRVVKELALITTPVLRRTRFPQHIECMKTNGGRVMVLREIFPRGRDDRRSLPPPRRWASSQRLQPNPTIHKLIAFSFLRGFHS